MFHWDLTVSPTAESTPEDLQAAGFSEEFPTQADAEAWLGEHYANMQDYGVEAVTLVEDGNTVYGPMGLEK